MYLSAISLLVGVCWIVDVLGVSSTFCVFFQDLLKLSSLRVWINWLVGVWPSCFLGVASFITIQSYQQQIPLNILLKVTTILSQVQTMHSLKLYSPKSIIQIRVLGDCFCLSFCCVLAVYNIMLTRQRVQLTQHLQSFNITAGNQKQRGTPFRKRKSNSTSLHNYSFVKMRASTAMSETQPPPEERYKPIQKQTIDIQTLNKSKPQHDNHYKKRKHITDSVDNSYGMSLFVKNSEKETNKNQQSSERRKNEVGTILQSKRSTAGPISITSKINYAKKSRTGKQMMLNDLHFQSWINEVLLESCEEKFDRSISLGALKKYMIDSASLAAFGINEGELSRIYRGLHVYSVGFSRLIKEIKGVSAMAYRNIWRVYSILLEHCSTGDFQTLMSEIESQNVRKLQKLEDELQEKQEIIEQNDELNRQKNSKIFKQIKALKEQNFQLVLQKDVINNDCREFQKAFNEEVSLRMLFEQKISSLYCVYNELSNKHSVLYKDFHLKSTELQATIEENKRVMDENTRVKKEMFGIQSDNKILFHQNAQLKEQLGRLQEQHRKRSTHENELKLQRSNMTKELLQAQQECRKMGKGLQIVEGNNKLLSQTYHLLQMDYQQCLNENRKLLSTLQEQFSINKMYFQERQKLDRGLVNYQNEKAMYQLKIADRQKIIKELKDKVEALQDKINDMQRESEIVQENIARLNDDVVLSEENIKKLKTINDQNQILIVQQQAKINKLEEELLKLAILKDRFEDSNRQNYEKLNDLDCKNKALTGQIQILNERLSVQIKARHKAKQIDVADRKKDQRQLNIIKKDCLNRQIEVDKLKQVYENTMLQLKNERFQMKNLDLSYKQCLTVIDNYSKVIKDINSKHSDLQDKLEQEKRVKKIIEINYSNELKKLNTENKMLGEKTKELTEYNRKHKNCTNPMIIQDLYSRLQRLQQKEQQREQLLSNQRKIAKESEQKYKQALSQRETEITELSSKLKETVQKLTLQIQYQKKKNVELSKELQDIQLHMVGLKNSYKLPIQQFKEKEMKYLQIIKQKKQKVETLIDEIEIMHDKNHKLMEQITYSQKEFSSQRQKLAEIQETLQVIKNEKQRVESQRDLAIHQVGQMMKQFKLQIPQNFGRHAQFMEMISKNISNTSSDVYIRQQTKYTEKYGVEAYREGKNIQHESNNEKRGNQNSVPKTSSEKERRQDFIHKFKHATQYYAK